MLDSEKNKLDLDQMDLETNPRSIGFDADENGQSRQAQHQIPTTHIFSVGVLFFCALPHMLKFFTWIISLVAAALFMLYSFQNHACFSSASTNRLFESTKYKHENNGAGHNF
jgi:hypothetical protein